MEAEAKAEVYDPFKVQGMQAEAKVDSEVKDPIKLQGRIPPPPIIEGLTARAIGSVLTN